MHAGTSSGPRGLFLIDTGALRTLVALEYAADVPGAKLGSPASVRGYGGKLQSARGVRGIRLGFQGAAAPADGLAAADLKLQSRLSGVEVSGFLGLDMLSGTRVVINTHARRVRLVPARSP